MVKGNVLLVGSLPFKTAEEAFLVSSSHLGNDVPCLPDGEIGPRHMWVAFLPREIYSHHPDLVTVGAEDIEHTPVKVGFKAPEGTWRDNMSGWKFRIPAGTDFHFDDLQYGSMAIESYRDFARLREEGKIPEGVRFQVCFPGTGSATDVYFTIDCWDEAHAAYEEGIRNEIAKILEVVPAEDLTIQRDLAMEIVDLSIGDQINLPDWPQLTYDEKFTRHAASLSEMSKGIPDEVMFGYHWCYGTFGGWPMSEMPDLQLCVDLSNEAVKRSVRSVDYMHMPVVKHPGDGFFKPLEQLDVGDCKIYLGLVHHTDGIEGFRERATAARKYLGDFGVGSVCGYGRLEVDELPAVLELHHECGEELAVLPT